MIQLTQEQHLTLENNGAEPVRAIDPTTLVEYVLVRAEIYERLKMVFADDGEWIRDSYPAAMEVFARDGWDDPRMDVYDLPDSRRE